MKKIKRISLTRLDIALTQVAALLDFCLGVLCYTDLPGLYLHQTQEKVALGGELGMGQQNLLQAKCGITKAVHHLVPGTTHDGGENCSRSIIPSKAGFAEP